MPVNYGSLPFLEALAFFRAKLNLPTQRWDDLLGAAHDRAFVVAGATKADLLADLRRAVDQAIADGTTIETFRKDFKRIVAERGWTGWTGQGTKAGEAWRTRVLYETNLFSSYSAGRYQQMKAVAATRPYWRYRHSPASTVPRAEHLAWDGLILRHDDPFWASHAPPNGFGCKCYIETLADRDLKKQNLTVTPKGQIPYNALDPKTGLPQGVDKGWNYPPGRNRYELDQMLLDPKLKRLFGDTPPAAIAHGAKAEAIALTLKDFLERFGENVPAFKSLKIRPGLDAGMATNGDGEYFFGNVNPQYRADLNRALLKIRQGEAMTPDEESMIKTLWHEIGHNRQTGLKTQAQVDEWSVTHAMLEATNEFVALRTYPQFLRAIGGGQAQYAEEVRAQSGYKRTVGRIESLMRAVGANPDDMLPEVERITFSGPIDDGQGGTLIKNLAEAIAKAGRANGYKVSGPKVEKVLDVIQNQDKFKKELVALTKRKKP